MEPGYTVCPVSVSEQNEIVMLRNAIGAKQRFQAFVQVS